MGIFTTGSITESISDVFKNPNKIFESSLMMEAMSWTDEQIKEFCAPGGIGEELVSEGKLSKKTIMRLSKKDDLSRRTKKMCLDLARENNDPLWDQLAKNRIKERELIAKIVHKYSSKGSRLAVQAQKDFIKNSRLPKSFMRAGGEERVSKD